MKPTYISKSAVSFYALLLFIALFQFSCSKDSPVEEVADDIEQPIDEDQEGTEETDPEEDPDETDPDSSLFLEEGFILDKERKLTNMVLSNEEYNKFLNDDGDFRMVTNKVYEYFEDEFDFIFILSVEDSQPSGLYYGISYKTKNDIGGIGSSIYDGTASYGSQGKLKSVIHMPRSEYIRNGPFLHEIAHYWANHGLIASTVGGHWGYSNAGGQLGGFDELQDLGNSTYQGKLEGENGFGTFANGGNSVPYGNLELYTMGLIGAGDLATIQLAENPQSTQVQGQFIADAIISISPAELIAQHGERTPNVQNSQKSFTALTVIISKATIGQDKIDDINLDLENFSREGEPDSYWGNLFNFWKATYGNASLDVQISTQYLK